MERIVATLGKRSYPITTASDLFNEPASFLPLKSDEQAMLVTNETLTSLYLDKVRGVLGQTGVNVGSAILSDDEQYKSLAVLNTVFTALLQKPHDRNTTLVALDGGVVGDLTGLTTASYQRGTRFIRVLTTLLSQIDSSVGGKTAINYPLDKDIIGAFYQPASAVVDFGCLRMLPPHELMSGLAEVTKYGITSDSVFFSWLEESLDALLRLDGPAMAYYARRCCELRAEVVAADRRETGLRALLSLGYTFGHAIEAEMEYGSQLHGETAAAGMMMTVRTSGHLKQFSSAETQHIITLLKWAELPINGSHEMLAQAYLPYMLRDKKVLMGEIHLILLLAIGRNEVHSGVSHELILNAIADCQSA